MELREVASIVVKRRLLVLAVMLLASGLGAALAFSQPKRYEATVSMVLQPNPDGEGGFLPSDTLSTLLGSYAAIVESRSNLDRAAANLGHPLAGSVEASTEAGSGVLHVTGRADTPNNALETARSATDAFRERVEGIDSPLVPDTVDPGALPTSAAQPKPKLIIPLAGILGFAAGVLLVLFLEQFRRRIETVEDVAALTQAPVLALIPRGRRLTRSKPSLVSDDPRLHELQESIRSLRTNLMLVLESRRRSIQITSLVRGEGKSTVAANLAVSLAQLGVPTVVVDADISRPAQGSIFGLPPTARGLTSWLAAPDRKLDLLDTPYENLRVVPSGPRTPGAADRLHVNFPALLRHLDPLEVMVIVDSPPLLDVSDARVISRWTDDVLLVVTAGRERPASLAGALETLVLADAHLLGLVMNQVVGAQTPHAYYEPEEEPAGIQNRPPAVKSPDESPDVSR
jgi:capsular exopolysaccharide synthesis family protein